MTSKLKKAADLLTLAGSVVAFIVVVVFIFRFINDPPSLEPELKPMEPIHNCNVEVTACEKNCQALLDSADRSLGEVFRGLEAMIILYEEYPWSEIERMPVPEARKAMDLVRVMEQTGTDAYLKYHDLYSDEEYFKRSVQWLP